MIQDDITRRLLLTSEICQQLQLYAQEITRENVSRAYLEAFATRALKRCAQLYVLSRPDAFAGGEAQPASHPHAPLGEAPGLCIVRADSITRNDARP